MRRLSDRERGSSLAGRLRALHSIGVMAHEPFPAPPSVPDEQRARALMSTRFEDITQRGRLVLDAIPHGLDATCWERLLGEHPIGRMAKAEAIVPILSRIRVESLPGTVNVMETLEAEGRWLVGRTVDPLGETSRLMLNLHAEVSGPSGRALGAPPEDAGESIPLGRVHAEHVFTRPFGPREERKVLGFPEGYGLPSLPEAVLRWTPPSHLTRPPETAKRLDPEPVLLPSPIVFGLTHTDSNQHVNSLVYPRLFEEAALERFAALGLDTEIFARSVEVAYRKPCFAGDRLGIQVQSLELDGRLGAVGSFVPLSGDDRRPHCHVQIWFD